MSHYVGIPGCCCDACMEYDEKTELYREMRELKDEVFIVTSMLLDDFVFLRDKCKELGMNWTLGSEDCFQYIRGKNLLERIKEEE